MILHTWNGEALPLALPNAAHTAQPIPSPVNCSHVTPGAAVNSASSSDRRALSHAEQEACTPLASIEFSQNGYGFICLFIDDGNASDAVCDRFRCMCDDSVDDDDAGRNTDGATLTDDGTVPTGRNTDTGTATARMTTGATPTGRNTDGSDACRRC